MTVGDIITIKRNDPAVVSIPESVPSDGEVGCILSFSHYSEYDSGGPGRSCTIKFAVIQFTRTLTCAVPIEHIAEGPGSSLV